MSSTDVQDLDFLTSVHSAPDMAALKAVFEKKTRDMGFERFAHIHFAPPRKTLTAHSTTNYPKPWVERYTRKSYLFSDPTILRSKTTIEPHMWRFSEDLSRKLTPIQRTLFSEAIDFGVSKGATVPIHGHGSEFAVVAVTCSEPDEEFDRIWRARRFELHLAALYFHIAARKFIIDLDNHPPCRLSPRESECLLWTARGKTVWEISQLLSISEHTALSHLRNAMTKLGTYSKIHAVAKAILIGLIHP